MITDSISLAAAQQLSQGSPTNDTAAEENRRAQQERLCESFAQYKTAKSRYENAEIEAIKLYDLPPAHDLPPQENEAFFILIDFREKFDELRMAYDEVLASHMAYEHLGATDDPVSVSHARERNQVEYDFNHKTQIFTKNLKALSRRTQTCTTNMAAFEAAKIAYQAIKKDVNESLEECFTMINKCRSIDVQDVRVTIADVRSQLETITVLHKCLHDTYLSGAEFHDDEMDFLDQDYCQLRSTSEHLLIKLENILPYASAENHQDYVTHSGAKSLILTLDLPSKRVRAKVAGAGMYLGEWQDGKPHGYGELRFHDGTVYEGHWIDGLRHGSGSQTDPDGTHYTGEWRSDKKNGPGVQVLRDGSRFEGKWIEGVARGTGVAHNSDGVKIDVTLKNKHCIEIAEGRENFDCFHQMLLGATNSSPSGYAEIAILHTAKETDNISLNTHLNPNEYTGYRKAMLGFVDQAHQWMLCHRQDRSPAWEKNMEFSGNGILFTPLIPRHSIKVEVLPPKANGGHYAVTIFNSGDGLEHHNNIVNTRKFETRLTVYYDAAKIHYLHDIFVNSQELDVKGFYDIILHNESKAPPKKIDAQPNYRTVHQTFQISGNCTIESWMAVFKNKAVQMHGSSGLIYYNKFRNELMEHALNAELKNIGAPTLSHGEHKRDIKVIANVQKGTIIRLSEITHLAEKLFPRKPIKEVLKEYSKKLCPHDTDMQNAILSRVDFENLETNLAAIKADKEWSLNDGLLACAFSKIVKRELEILGAASLQESGSKLISEI
ncbi:MORN repeat-containing protein [Pandoraea sputorum]|uniref:MORN repeat-containing protein n=1 Tax=Pandoraea sputorum TaxID=93222 RepID=UPI0012401551|nr:hypothetical protein [Pandoraea sputorum]